MTRRDLPGAITRRTRTCRRPQVPRACSVARRQRYTDTTSAERRRRVDDVHADLRVHFASRGEKRASRTSRDAMAGGDENAGVTVGLARTPIRHTLAESTNDVAPNSAAKLASFKGR